MTAVRVETSAEDGSMHITPSGETDLANAAAVEEEIRAAVSGCPRSCRTCGPNWVLVDVSDADAEHLKSAFGITTVRDPGTNKFFLWAQGDHEAGRLTGRLPHGVRR